jgi:CBS domain-containing protein
MNLLDICSNELITAPDSATVIEVAWLMREKHVGAVVVMADTLPRHPIGIVTDRDLVIKVMAFADRHIVTSIEEVMSTNLAVVPGSTGIHEAVELMRDRGVRRLLVVSENGDPKGIVSLDDLVMVMAQEMGIMSQAIVAGMMREGKTSES